MMYIPTFGIVSLKFDKKLAGVIRPRVIITGTDVKQSAIV